MALGYAQEVEADQPVLYYRLNETSGTVAANTGSASGVDGEYVGDPILGFASNPIPGETANTSVVFDGNGDAVKLPAATNQLLAGASGVTIEGWIYSTANQTLKVFFNQQVADGSAGIYCDLENNQLRFGGRSQPGDAFQDVAAPAQFPEDVWVHVAGTMNFAAGEIILYQDGAEVARNSSATFGSSTYNPTAGGIRPDSIGASFFSGAIDRELEARLDEVALYDKVLDATRISTHYVAKDNAPQAQVTFVIEGTVTLAHDSSPASRAVQLYGVGQDDAIGALEESATSSAQDGTYRFEPPDQNTRYVFVPGEAGYAAQIIGPVQPVQE